MIDRVVALLKSKAARHIGAACRARRRWLRSSLEWRAAQARADRLAGRCFRDCLRMTAAVEQAEAVSEELMAAGYDRDTHGPLSV